MHGRSKRKHGHFSLPEAQLQKKRNRSKFSTKCGISRVNEPTLKLSNAGQEAELTVPPAVRRPLLLSELRSQVHWACLRNYYDPYNLDWCSLTKKPTQTTIIIVDGISVAVLEDISRRHAEGRVCSEQPQYNRHTTSMDDAGARYASPRCDGWSQNSTQDSSTAPGSNSWDDSVEKGAVPETCISSTLEAIMPNCCRYLDVRLEMVAPDKYQQTVLHELFLIRCPSSTAASIKSGNLVPPQTLLKITPRTEACWMRKSDENEWLAQYTSSSSCGTDSPAYEDIVRTWSITQSAEALNVSRKWTKQTKNVINTCAAVCDQFDRRQMLLSVKQMIELNFPLPDCVTNMFAKDDFRPDKPLKNSECNLFVPTKDVYAKVTPSSPMFGVDCEFVLAGTKPCSVLGSIAIVNEHGSLVYHTLVKPDQPIINYLTKWSGLTEEMMAPVTTSLADVQAKIRRYLPPDAILVGHSIDNDLRVMKMCHPYVVDTSVLYNLSGSKNPSKLKILVSHFLRREIQSCNGRGHDPSEDAAAALQLALLKLQHDMKFGNLLLSSRADVTLPEHNLFYSMFEYYEDWHRLHSSSASSSRPLRDRLLLLTTRRHEEEFGRALQGLQSSAALRVVDSNGEIVDAACGAAMMSDISVLWLEADARLQSSKTKTRLAALRDLDDCVGRIVNASPAGALVSLIFAGSQSTVTQTSSNGIYMAGIRTLQ